MKRSIYLAGLLALAVSAPIACAAGEETRTCDFELKARCTSVNASVTLTDGVVTKLEVGVFTCGLAGRPGYTCTIDSSRSEKDDTWSEDGGATVITNGSPFNPTAPDRVTLTVG